MDNFLYTQNATIFNNDLVKGWVDFPANSDICITKIPIRKIDGFSENFITDFAKKLYNSMVKNGIVFLICYAPSECKSRPFYVAKIMEEQGFYHIDNIIIEKSWVSGRNKDNMLLNSHEYVLFFSKSPNWMIDKKSLEIFFGIDKNEFLGNNWLFESGLLKEAITIPLAEALMRMIPCLPGALIIDPFMSNSSTLRVALKLGYSFWGCEKEKKRMKDYDEIIKKYKEEIGLYEFIESNKK